MLMENIDNFVTEFVNLKNDIDLKNIQFAYDYLFAFILIVFVITKHVI